MSKRILIVEDQEDNRKILRDLLTSAGFAPVEAITGEEGVRLAESERPDLTLMDIQLPGHRRDLLRPERRRLESPGGRLRRLRHQALQPESPPRQGAGLPADKLGDQHSGISKTELRAERWR